MGLKIWYMPSEVVIHNKPNDCWISFNGKVLNVAPLIREQVILCKCRVVCKCNIEVESIRVESYKSCDTQHLTICKEYCPCFCSGCMCNVQKDMKIILAYAGKDVSHWFEDGKDEFKTQMHPIADIRYFYQQHGLLPYQHVMVPSTQWRPTPDVPWWKDDRLVVGKLTSKVRPLLITNTLIGLTVKINVCEEETIYEIMEFRYGNSHNCHYASYDFRYDGRPLCYKWTLTQNGILDDRERFFECGLPDDIYVPNIMIYFKDDLTVGFDELATDALSTSNLLNLEAEVK